MFINATRGLIAATVLGVSALAAQAQDFTPENPECIAPANPGGGWDFTCRQVGKELQDLGLIGKTMQVVNLAGGGGGVAFAEVVNKRADDNDLIVAASSATATRLAQGAYPGNTTDQVRWLASIGADYGVIAVSADSEIETLPQLLDMIKNDPRSVSVAGGSAVGGWDHLKVLIAASAYGIEDVRTVKYVAFDGGGEAVTQLLAGSVQAFTPATPRKPRALSTRGTSGSSPCSHPSVSKAISPTSRPPRSRASTPSARTGAASTRRAA